MKRIVFLALLFLPSPAYAWTEADTYRQVAVVGFLALDWRQTIDIAEHDEYWETNPILGKYPSIQSVDNYFAAVIVGHTLVSYLLPPDWRKIWQYVWIGAEAKQIFNNYSIGIGFHF